MQIIETPPSADDFCNLRLLSGLSSRPLNAVIKALPASLYGVHLVMDGILIGMGRVVGDGALNFEIVDIAVHPDHQGKGYGRIIMHHIMRYISSAASPGSYVCLMAEVPNFYEKFGFQRTQHPV